ncbi:MAG: response regulator [Rhodoferax sp.]|nr:response regulator [Rhodoferax sp.]
MRLKFLSVSDGAYVPLVLVVDDMDINRKLLETYLVCGGYRVALSSSGVDALEQVQLQRPQLILLDVRMSGMDGYAVCQALKENPQTRDIPVIFITAENTAEAERRAFAAGGADFIARPMHREVTLARVKTHLDAYAQRRSLEGMFRDVLEFAPDAFVLTDVQGKIVQINACAERMFGYARRELQQFSLERLLPQRLKDGYSAAQGCRKDGSVFPAEVSFAPLQTNRGILNMAVIRDVSLRKRAESDLKESRQQLRELAAKREANREDERKHIAREVHDELGQILTALRIDLSLLKIQLGNDNPTTERKLQEMKDLVDQGIHAVRNVAVSLRPAALDMGLVPAIEWLCDHHARQSAARIAFESDEENIAIDEVRAIIIFRIVQESLTNIARYAKAARVLVRIEHLAGELCVKVSDDGMGFNVEQVGRNKTFGLLGMRERAIALGGVLDLESSVGGGTRITVRIPMDNAQHQGTS